MAQSDFVDPPQAQGFWNVNLSKMAVLFWKWVTGAITPAVAVQGQGSTVAPAGFEKDYAYYGSTNNVHTITFKQGSTVLGKVTYTYVGSGVANNDQVATEVWSAS